MWEKRKDVDEKNTVNVMRRLSSAVRTIPVVCTAVEGICYSCAVGNHRRTVSHFFHSTVVRHGRVWYGCILESCEILLL